MQEVQFKGKWKGNYFVIVIFVNIFSDFLIIPENLS